jgi:hypothetical protein
MSGPDAAHDYLPCGGRVSLLLAMMALNSNLKERGENFIYCSFCGTKASRRDVIDLIRHRYFSTTLSQTPTTQDETLATQDETSITQEESPVVSVIKEDDQ